MVLANGSSGSFRSRIRSIVFLNNTYTDRRSNFCSKTTPIHGPVYKSDLNISYSRSHFNRLPQAVSKGMIIFLSQKVSYDSMIIDPVINIIPPNEIKIHLHVCDQKITPFFIRGLCLRFSNTSCVDSLEKFRKTVVDEVKFDITSFKSSMLKKK